MSKEHNHDDMILNTSTKGSISRSKSCATRGPRRLADSAISYEQRIEILGQHIFGDLRKPRNIPGGVSRPPETTVEPPPPPASEKT